MRNLAVAASRCMASRGRTGTARANFRTFRTLSATTPLLNELATKVDVSYDSNVSSFNNTTSPLRGTAHLSARLRKSPYFQRTVDMGVCDFTVYNRMLMPLGYGSPEQEYQALTEGVAMWDVSAQRQVELRGPDAAALAQYLTPRDLSQVQTGTCVYAIMCDDEGIVINDPVLLKLDENHFWFSIADSDVLLWAKAMALARGMHVKITEPDVSPLAVQGPRSLDLMRDLFGSWVDDLKYFHFRDGPETVLDGDIPLLVARSGWSPERGYELYLKDSTKGNRLWDLVAEHGARYGIIPGAPNQQRRMEAGMISFGGDTLPDTNALELGLPRKFVNPFGDYDFVGKEALQRIHEEGPKRRFAGIMFDQQTVPETAEFQGQHHPLISADSGEECGVLTASTYSPRFERHIGVGFVNSDVAADQNIFVQSRFGKSFSCTISKLPFTSPDGMTSGRSISRKATASGTNC